jgi:glycogen debranching enzyme
MQRKLKAECRAHAIELLKRNLGPDGILAATPGTKARRRGYTSIFGRDAAVCAIGMALSGDAELIDAAATGLETLARFQAPNGQLPKFANSNEKAGDFWYLGCIDSTLWWLIGLVFLERQSAPRGLLARHGQGIARALEWLQAQEHQRFFLLQQNEASDWADIMPRSGFVLYTNALWYCVKQSFGLPHLAETRANFNGLFHPFRGVRDEYRRARLLNYYSRRSARDKDLYLSFVNFSFAGNEGDVFGNVLGVLTGAMDPQGARHVMHALSAAAVDDPYPIRAVVRPIRQGSFLWRSYMERHRQNFVWQYHNGGIWPMVGSFWIAALSASRHKRRATQALGRLEQCCALEDWGFTEWRHGRTLSPNGMPGQSWNAAGYLMAEHALANGVNPLDLPLVRAQNASQFRLAVG